MFRSSDKRLICPHASDTHCPIDRRDLNLHDGLPPCLLHFVLRILSWKSAWKNIAAVRGLDDTEPPVSTDVTCLIERMDCVFSVLELAGTNENHLYLGRSSIPPRPYDQLTDACAIATPVRRNDAHVPVSTLEKWLWPHLGVSVAALLQVHPAHSM